MGEELPVRCVQEVGQRRKDTKKRAFSDSGRLCHHAGGQLRAVLLKKVERGIVDYFTHIHAVLPPPKHETVHSPDTACVRDTHKDRFVDLRDWVVSTMAPHADALNVTPETYAHFLKALAMGMAMSRSGGLTPEDITRFALDGARRKDLT